MRGKSFNQPLHETNAVSKLPIEQANAVKALIISAWKRKSNIMRQLCLSTVNLWTLLIDDIMRDWYSICTSWHETKHTFKGEWNYKAKSNHTP
jgi:hypothetical protein